MKVRDSTAERRLHRLWYEGRPRWALALLAPLSLLFGALAAARRAAFGVGLLRSIRLPRPVIVVGNISVGGAGKTPLTIWLAEQLGQRGLKVGVVLRGYQGRSRVWPREVDAATSAEEVGDEAVLIAARTNAIVAAGPDRVAAAKLTIARGAQIVLSDDGLQHYRLARDAEIAVLDAQRGIGNGWLLPAGPLRETAPRLRTVDAVVVNRRAQGATAQLPAVTAPILNASASIRYAVNLRTAERRELASFAGQRVHAIAGIGNPHAFFEALAALGLQVDAHPFADHAAFSAADLRFDDEAPVLMTEKDAVKCRAFADQRCWAVRLELEFDARDAAALLTLVDRITSTRAAYA